MLSDVPLAQILKHLDHLIGILGEDRIGLGSDYDGAVVPDDVIDPKTRSMMNLSMIGALGKMTEWELHCRGAIRNGVSFEELRAIIHVIGIYCGVPQSLECFRAARKVLEEEGIEIPSA